MPANAPAPRRLIIYCDESDDKGKYFSHFYGGAAVDANKRERLEKALNDTYAELQIQGEMKWTKIGSGHERRYIEMMDVFFDFIKNKEIKVRIMFLQNMFSARDLEDYHINNEYFILYYHFIKHAFGLQHCNPQGDRDTYIQLLFDEFPNNKDRADEFKDYLESLNRYPLFRRSRVKVVRDDIGEINSKNHIIAQCLDVVLGSIQFRLNDKHLEKPAGQRRRGKRTIAKEKVYKHINRRIRDLYPHFNIGISTGQPAEDSRWKHEYRHWRFVPTNAVVDPTRAKPK